jgi:hypothetical protein
MHHSCSATMAFAVVYAMLATAVPVMGLSPRHAVDRSFLQDLDASTDEQRAHNLRVLKGGGGGVLGDILPSPRDMIEIGITVVIALFLYRKYKESGIGR